MMTSSGEGWALREVFFAPPCDFLGFWPEDRRDFMNWIVAFGRGPCFVFRIAK